MASTPITTSESRVAAGLDGLARALVCVLPLAMAVSNRSAQPILVAAALASLAARAGAGELPGLRDKLTALVATPIGLGTCAFLAFGALSIAWSHHVRVSLGAYGELALAVASAVLLHAALPRPLPAWVAKFATIALALGCLLIIAELATGMALRASLGARAQAFVFKRSVSAILLVAWPVGLLLWVSGRRSIALALGLLLGMASYAAHSGATLLGLGCGAALALAAALSRRAGAAAVAGLLGLSMLVAPILGDAAEHALPAPVVQFLQRVHARDRIEIWQSFGEVVKRRPIGGAGFGTSPVMDQEPVAEEVPAEKRVLLGAWHPHNGYLQVWVEMGAIGALLAGAVLVASGLGLRLLSWPQAVAAAGIAGSAGAIMLVGHGLWQGWWSATLGIAAVWVARLPGTTGDRR